MSRSTFKILFYVKKGSERANGYLPLMCRLTVDGEIKQFSCKLDVPPKLWDVKTARATGKSAEAQKINAAVDRIRVDVNRRYQELMQSDGYVTAARLRDACLGLGVKRETLLKLNTVWGYMIGLKHVISIARNSGALPFNPFAGYINSPESVDRGYLTEREIQTLMEAPVKSGTCELVRDLFIFSVFTGLAYADVKALTTDRLQTFFDGNLWIITRRRKTNTESNIRLLDVPKRIIEKYKGLSKDDHVFPVPSNGRCNTILKELGRQCGFKIRLTYHVARHTNATTVLLSHGVPIETVSRLLGHTDLKTTQIYARITNQKISSDMEILSHKLEKMEKEICDAI